MYGNSEPLNKGKITPLNNYALDRTSNFDLRTTDDAREVNLAEFQFCTSNDDSSRSVRTLEEGGRTLLSRNSNLIVLAQKIARIVENIPISNDFGQMPRALIVGGLIRDTLTGKTDSKDLDLEIYGVSMADLQNHLISSFGEDRVKLEGESFQAIKVFLEDASIDVTIPRRDSKTGTGHKGFEVTGDPSMTITEAARRRDFTINTFAADPLNGKIYDPFNGLSDLQAGILRAVDFDRFADDPLRVYRGVQFMARMGLTVEPETESLLISMVAAGMLDELPRKRVTDEMHKLLLKADSPSIGLEYMRTLGITERHWPELHALIGVPQDPIWHPEGDVWRHTLMVVDQARGLIAANRSNPLSEKESQEVMWAALAHDLGKVATTKFENGRFRAHGHEAAGAEPAREMLDRIEIHSRSRHVIIACVERHLLAATLYQSYMNGSIEDRGYANAVRKVLRHIGPDKMDVFLTVAEADHRGRTTQEASDEHYRPAIKFREVASKHGCLEESRTQLITGKDLISMGLKPAPIFGEIQQRIEALRDEGVIATKSEALSLVHGWLEQ
jgi:tRNA nucleotidyltransferase (CCA-adding enzyme)